MAAWAASVLQTSAGPHAVLHRLLSPLLKTCLLELCCLPGKKPCEASLCHPVLYGWVSAFPASGQVGSTS